MSIRDPLLGQQIGNYRLERLLGQGGMAKVYYGWDTRLQRPAAVKVIIQQFRDNESYRERFLREARTAASWKHPNILQIYTAGEENGIPYFAMELIRGMDLGRLLQAYAQAGDLMPPSDVLVIGRALAGALDYAHQKGVIHRDVKPSNVLISEDDRVVLADFGLVMIVSQGTMGKVFGSPHYIAPEQARSSAAAVPQSDLYSLGVMLYEMLVGALPFDDPNPASLALKHIAQQPPSPREINPSLSPAVEEVLLKGLRKAPQDRYETCLEMVEALGKALGETGKPEPLVPATLTELPSFPGALTPQTLTHISFAARAAGFEGAPLFPAQPSPAQTSRQKDRQPAFPRTWAGLGIGCAVLLALGVLVVILGTAITLARQQAARAAGTPTRMQSATPLPGLAPTPSIEPSNALTEIFPDTFELVFRAEKDDSLFVIFRGQGEFPLQLLELKSNQGEILGTEWGVETLRSGECVTAWKDNDHAQPPKGVQCIEVGKRLVRDGPERLWKGNYSVYYQGEFFGECRPELDYCVISITP